MSSLCRRRALSRVRGRLMKAALFGLALAASASLASCAKQPQSAQPTGRAQSQSTGQQSQQQSAQQSAEVLQTQSPRETHVLRVCADPNNMPFSNERGEGFENRIVETI